METVTIPKTEYDELCRTKAIYYALSAAGVDNWEGWDDAMDMLKE